jgi:hypothetical protein
MTYPVIMISIVNLSQNPCSPSTHKIPKKKKKKAVAIKIIQTMVYPKWICIPNERFNGTIRLRNVSPNAAIEKRLIVMGINAIWNKMACIEPVEGHREKKMEVLVVHLDVFSDLVAC